MTRVVERITLMHEFTAQWLNELDARRTGGLVLTVAFAVTGCSLESDLEEGRRNTVPGYNAAPATTPSAPATPNAAPTRTSSPAETTPTTPPAVTVTETATTTSTTVAPAPAPRTTHAPAPAIPDEVSVVPDYSALDFVDGCTAVGGSPYAVPIRNAPFCDAFVLNHSDGAGGLAYPHEAYGDRRAEAVTALCKVLGQENTEWTVVRLDSSWADTSQADVGYAPTAVLNPGAIDACKGTYENPANEPTIG